MRGTPLLSAQKGGSFMKYISQYLIILAIGFASEMLNALIPAPIPTCIYGIVILFFLLFTGLLKLDSIKDAARFLIDVQPVMFVPAGVGLIVIWNEVKDSILKYIIVCIISTAVVMAVSGRVTQFIIRRTGKGGSSNE